MSQTSICLPSPFGPQSLELAFSPGASLQNSGQARQSSPKTVSAFLLQDHEADNENNHRGRITDQNVRYWFRTPQDPEFIKHLLDLYFTWVHPFHQIFSRDQFLTDFTRMASSHCSAFLVNAIAAFACHYTDISCTFARLGNYPIAGDYFFAEAKWLLTADEEPSLTIVQALGIMGLREISHGRVSNGYQYMGRCLRTALEMGLNVSAKSDGLPPAVIEERKITFWGVFNFEAYVANGPVGGHR